MPDRGASLVRVVKILLCASVAVWGLVSGLMNLLHYNPGPVAAVLSIEGRESLRAIANPLTVNLGYAFIYLGKFATGGLCAFGAHRLWQGRQQSDAFNRAKSWALAGCGVGMLFLYFGFYVVARSIFSTGAPTALSNAYLSGAFWQMGALGLIALYIAVPDREA